MTDMVGLVDVAKQLKLDGSTVRRYIARMGDTLGIELHRGKGDKILLSRDDADRLITSYESRRGPIGSDAEVGSSYDPFGFFYIIQLIPEALPNRVKIGFADNVERRLAEHRTAAPTAPTPQAMALQEVVGLRSNGKHFSRGMQACPQ